MAQTESENSAGVSQGDVVEGKVVEGEPEVPRDGEDVVGPEPDTEVTEETLPDLPVLPGTARPVVPVNPNGVIAGLSLPVAAESDSSGTTGEAAKPPVIEGAKPSATGGPAQTPHAKPGHDAVGVKLRLNEATAANANTIQPASSSGAPGTVLDVSGSGTAASLFASSEPGQIPIAPSSAITQLPSAPGTPAAPSGGESALSPLPFVPAEQAVEAGPIVSTTSPVAASSPGAAPPVQLDLGANPSPKPEVAVSHRGTTTGSPTGLPDTTDRMPTQVVTQTVPQAGQSAASGGAVLTDGAVTRPAAVVDAQPHAMTSPREGHDSGTVTAGPWSGSPGSSRAVSPEANVDKAVSPRPNPAQEQPSYEGHGPSPQASRVVSRAGMPARPAVPGTVQDANRAPDQAAPIVPALPSLEAEATDPSQLSQDVNSSGQRALSQMPFPQTATQGDVRRFEEIVRLLDQPQLGRPMDAGMAVGPHAGVPPWSALVTKGATVMPAFSASLEQLDVPDQIVRAIRVQWQNGVGEARLRLNPANLGEVTVSLQVRQASVSAVLSAESEAIRQWIRANQHELNSPWWKCGLPMRLSG